MRFLDYPLTVSCFWIVSRGNNCHYCLGHQELQLRAGGLDDDTIASLDSDWERFEPRTKAAFAFARKLTLEPQLVDADDIADLKQSLHRSGDDRADVCDLALQRHEPLDRRPGHPAGPQLHRPLERARHT